MSTSDHQVFEKELLQGEKVLWFEKTAQKSPIPWSYGFSHLVLIGAFVSIYYFDIISFDVLKPILFIMIFALVGAFTAVFIARFFEKPTQFYWVITNLRKLGVSEDHQTTYVYQKFGDISSIMIYKYKKRSEIKFYNVDAKEIDHVLSGRSIKFLEKTFRENFPDISVSVGTK